MSKKKEKCFDEFKVPKRKQPVFKVVKKVLKPFFGAKVESEIENLPDKAIIVSNHAAKKGPMAIAVSYKNFHVMWGHHDMLGTYKERFKYLRNVLYIQKMHKNKFTSTVKATYEAAFSVYFYKGMKILGTYTDMRFLTTVRNSMSVLDDNASVVIYPENSGEGYFDELRSVFPGFAVLATTYYRKKGEDVPIIPAYISTKEKRFILGAPKYAHELELKGMDNQAIADDLMNDINELYRKYIATGDKVSPLVDSAPVRNSSHYGEQAD